jgi:hypothetical protein
MSGGGDGGAFDFAGGENNGGLFGLGNFGSGGKGNFFENVLNTYLQTQTGGMVEYDKGFKGNVQNDVGLQIIKETSGAKAAEEANEMAREQFEEQKVAAEQDRNNQILQRGREQIQASQLAGAARRAGTNSNRSTGTVLGSDERDFLGL